MNIKPLIHSNIDNPPELERLYRQHPDAFKNCIDEMYATHSDSAALSVWHARLFYEAGRDLPTVFQGKSSTEIVLIILLSMTSGTFTKLPSFIEGIDSNFFYSRNFAFFVLPALAFYFVVRNLPGRRTLATIWVTFLVSILFINVLPDLRKSDTIFLASIHMPFFLWTVVGIAFTGDEFQSLSKRMEYLKYNGELLIYTTIILIGGVVLTALTVGLFSAIQIDILGWYVANVVVYGTVASPIVATYLIEKKGRRQRLAPVIARVFIPFFLATLVFYLLTILIQQKSLYTDRNFLLIFNIMLLIVLAITIFSISERHSTENRIKSDYLNIALVFVALLVDCVALSAIIFRLTEYGLTPNRIAVLGVNLVIFIHLVGMLYYYFRFLKGAVQMQQLHDWITRYLPIYTVWTTLIIFVFPFLYRFN